MLTWCQMGIPNAFWDGYLPKTEFEFWALKMCLAQTGMNVDLCSVQHHPVYPLSSLACTFACDWVCNWHAYLTPEILTKRGKKICSSGLDIWLTLLVHKQWSPQCLLHIQSSDWCGVKKANSEEGTRTVLRSPFVEGLTKRKCAFVQITTDTLWSFSCRDSQTFREK